MAVSFAAHVDVLPLNGRGLATISEDGCEIYSSPAFAAVAGLIDGRRDEAAILAQCPPSEQAEVASALGELRRAGVLIDAPLASESPLDAAWWDSQRIAPPVAAERVQAAAVRVRALGDIDPGPTCAALSSAGLAVGEPAGLDLVLVEDYLDDGLTEINTEALEERRPWMIAAPDSLQILVGPVFVPDEGPCWECLAQRMWLLRSVERHLRAIAGRPNGGPPRRGPRFAHGLGAGLVTMELARWQGGVRQGAESVVLSFDSRSLRSGRHHVTWRPQCPACGEAEPPADPHAAPIRLRVDGSHDASALREVTPEVTLRRFEHHVSPVSGAVQTLHRAAGADPLHVYVAGGPLVRVHGAKHEWDGLDRLSAGGKGTSDAAARASALCEALERYSGELSGEEPRRVATLRELGEAAVHPNLCMRFSDRQYDRREELNREVRSYRSWVPERLDADAAIEWSPCWSLTHACERWLPTSFLYYNADPPGTRFCVAESNGNSAGNTLEEAILHGLLELVERDHVALWWYNRLLAPTVELDTIDDPWLAQVRRKLASERRELWALDLTADLGLPAAVAMATSADGTRVGIGFGAHLDLARAVVRATTELVQLGLGAPSGGMGSGPEDLTLERYPFLRPEAAAGMVSAGPQREPGVLEALERCRAAIERQGLEVLVLDQTRPDIGLPVVKVIVPGLRHFWTRFAPGRLYDVPVALGRLEAPLAEEELTPRGPSS